MVTSCANPEQSFQEAEQLRSKEAYAQFINDFPKSKWVKKAEQRIAEINFWQTIKTSQAVDDYEKYISSFPDGLFHKEAQSQMLDIKKFQVARDKDLLDHYQNYLHHYPQGLFVQEATTRSAELKAADIGYQVIKSETNLEALKAYAKEFQDTGYSQLINKHIENLLTDTPAFQQAEKSRSKKAYQQFLKDFPHSKWVKKARQRIAELDFWNKIRLSQSLWDYQQYLNTYSDGFFRQQAAARIQEIKDMTVVRKTKSGCPDNQYALTVNVTPSKSKIRIMNIVPKYRPGICLTTGRYDIYITRRGYRSYRKWITLKVANMLVDVTLIPMVTEQHGCSVAKINALVARSAKDTADTWFLERQPRPSNKKWWGFVCHAIDYIYKKDIDKMCSDEVVDPLIIKYQKKHWIKILNATVNDIYQDVIQRQQDRTWAQIKRKILAACPN